MERQLRAEIAAGHVKALQIALKYLDFYAGPIDGIKGPATNKGLADAPVGYGFVNDWDGGRAGVSTVLARRAAERAVEDPGVVAARYPLELLQRLIAQGRLSGNGEHGTAGG